jgi:hypothetical protein
VNTVDAFLNTAENIEADITCPSCGGSMAAQLQGSYELVLSPRARNEFNNVLSLYRGFLLDLEEQLRTHNLLGVTRGYGLSYPYQGDGDFGDPSGSGLFKNPFVEKLDDYLSAFDRYERRRLIEELPMVAGRAGQLSDKTHAVIGNLLLGLEPNLIIGPLANVVLGQRHVAGWIDAMIQESAPHASRIGQLLQQVCPTIADYLRHMEQRAETREDPVLAGRSVLGEPPSPDDVLLLVRRAELVLVLLLGHRADDATELTRGFMRKDDPYRLPAEVQVQSRFLADIAAAAVLLRRSALGLSKDFQRLVSGGRFGRSTDESDPSVTAGEQLIAKHGREVAKLVKFVCTGEPSWLPPEVEEATGSRGAQRFRLEEVRRLRWSSTTTDAKVETISEILGIKENRSSWSSGQVWFEATRPSRCGWYPKNAPTHGVTLLGGPGVGKSTVMTTGLPTFTRAAFGLGLRIRFEDADDNLMYSAYDDLYWRGILPSPTELGVRHSIEFYAEETAEPTLRTHFVFTDIPGEIVAGGIQDPGTHPIIYNSLRHAKTIVFFLDLTLERDVRESILRNKDAAEYPRLGRSADETRTVRGGTPAEQDGPESRPSTADVSQKGLLYQLIEDLREVHGEEGLRDINFILVIPKADLYAHANGGQLDDGSPQPFLQSFFDDMRKLEILKPSPYLDRSLDEPRNAQTAPLSALRSNGALPRVNGRIADDPARVRDDYAEQLRKISDGARSALENVGATSSAGADPETEMFGNFLYSGLIQTLERIFTAERVHFFPVSAAGAGDHSKLESETKPGKKTAYQTDVTPPNQMLSELVFAAPISLALTRNDR